MEVVVKNSERHVWQKSKMNEKILLKLITKLAHSIILLTHFPSWTTRTEHKLHREGRDLIQESYCCMAKVLTTTTPLCSLPNSVLAS